MYNKLSKVKCTKTINIFYFTEPVKELAKPAAALLNLVVEEIWAWRVCGMVVTASDVFAICFNSAYLKKCAELKWSESKQDFRYPKCITNGNETFDFNNVF